VGHETAAVEGVGMTRIQQGTNVLVTGGTGFVGGHVVEELLRRKLRVFSTYIIEEPHSYFSRSHFEKSVTLIKQDIRDIDGIRHIVERFGIEYILHLAAQPIVEVAIADPLQTLDTNILGTANILEVARLSKGVRGVIVASSDKAYGKHGKKKYVETDELRGDHPYEASKSAADLLCTMYARTYGLPVVTTRFGNIYGEGDLNMSRIFPGILEALIRKKTLPLRSDGTYVRDYLYVKDVAKGYVQLMEHIDEVRGQAFNFGSKETLSVFELIKKVERGLKKKVKFTLLKRAQNEIPYQSLDYSKVKRAIGWEPKYNVSKTIRDMYRWYKDILTT